MPIGFRKEIYIQVIISSCYLQTSNANVNVGEELVGPLDKASILHVLNQFYTSAQMKELAQDYGLDGNNISSIFELCFAKYVVICTNNDHDEIT